MTVDPVALAREIEADLAAGEYIYETTHVPALARALLDRDRQLQELREAVEDFLRAEYPAGTDHPADHEAARLARFLAASDPGPADKGAGTPGAVEQPLSPASDAPAPGGASTTSELVPGHGIDAVFFDGESWRAVCECGWECWAETLEAGARKRHEKHAVLAHDGSANDGRCGEGVGYTLATGRLLCDMSEFHAWAEKLMGRPIFTHEFADERLWMQMREAFEAMVLAETDAEEPRP